MDINPFEFAGKGARRAYETAQDAYMLSECAFANSLPGKLFSSMPQSSSDTIMNAAKTALKHNDLVETQHQLNRELYFCSIVDELAGTKDELAAKAGLNAIAKRSSPKEVSYEMEMAPDNCKGLYSNAMDSVDRQLDRVRKFYERDPAGFALYIRNNKDKISYDRRTHDISELRKDLDSLTMLELGAAYKMLNSDPTAAPFLYYDAVKSLNETKKLGSDVSRLEKVARRVHAMLPWF